MNDLMAYLNGLMDDKLPSKEINTQNYIVTVSADPHKVKMKNKDTHEVLRIEDFNERELALLAYIAVKEGL